MAIYHILKKMLIANDLPVYLKDFISKLSFSTNYPKSIAQFVFEIVWLLHRSIFQTLLFLKELIFKLLCCNFKQFAFLMLFYYFVNQAKRPIIKINTMLVFRFVCSLNIVPMFFEQLLWFGNVWVQLFNNRAIASRNIFLF